MPEIESATRRTPKATYVPLIVPLDESAAGRAVPKYGFVSQLALQPGEVDAVRAALQPVTGSPPADGSVPDEAVLETLRRFEGAPPASQLPGLAAFAGTSAAQLVTFGQALVSVRQRALSTPGDGPPAPPLPAPPPPAPVADPAVTPGAAAAGAAITLAPPSALIAPPAVAQPEVVQAAISPIAPVSNASVHQAALVNAAQVAVNSFEQSISATPVGMLNLERSRCAGRNRTRRLLATIPLAPGKRPRSSKRSGR